MKLAYLVEGCALALLLPAAALAEPMVGVSEPSAADASRPPAADESAPTADDERAPEPSAAPVERASDPSQAAGTRYSAGDAREPTPAVDATRSPPAEHDEDEEDEEDDCDADDFGDDDCFPDEPPRYLGEAAPPTAAGRTGIAALVRPGLEVFAQYAYRNWASDEGRDWYHDFAITRAHLSLEARYEKVTARVVGEAARSASEGALIGVAGSSYVLRVREAWAGYELWRFTFAAGLVPTLTIPELEGTWRLRAVAPVPQEEYGFESPVDLGATVRFALPARHGWVSLGAYNGEGYNQRELNRSKSTELAASVHPFRSGPAHPLAIFAAGQLGSSGTGDARNHRAVGGLLWQGERLRAGAHLTYAWGFQSDGSRESLLFEGFVQGEPIDRFILGARASYWDRNTTGASADAVTTLLGTTGYRIADPLSAFLAVARNLPTAAAESSVPASDWWEFRTVVRVAF